jgi:hypothetical protein
MLRSASPSYRVVLPRLRRLARVRQLCGIATVIGIGTAAAPPRAEAQAGGTMQVLANVARAEEAWAGLNGARAMARSMAPHPGIPAPRQLDLALARIRWEPKAARPGTPAVATITIQYLRN